MEEYIKVAVGEDSFLYIHNECLGTLGTTHEFDPNHCLLNTKTGEKIKEKTFYKQIWGEDYGDLCDWVIYYYGEQIPVADILLKKEGD